MSGSITVVHVADRLAGLVVRCAGDGYAADIRVACLVERFEGELLVPELREKLSAECEKHGAAEYERRDLYFPDMLKVS